MTAGVARQTEDDATWWSGLETPGMKDAKCSLLLQEEADYDARIKALPKQRVTIHQDTWTAAEEQPSLEVDFGGATILQLEPSSQQHIQQQHTMPVTLTVGGRCVFTAENYQDFSVMMRTKAQAAAWNLTPNGVFDWPSVDSLLMCPVCSTQHAVPETGDGKDHEYWMVYYPLLQLSVDSNNHLTLGTRTICRFVCLECMEELLEGLTLQIRPSQKRLCFTLPASDVLAEAGSASFLEDGPPRPDTHPHVDDILDAWTLFHLWEHSGAWEALQKDYRLILTKSMGGADAAPAAPPQPQPRLKERMGKACGNKDCSKVHGQTDSSGNICRLVYKCRDCCSAFYCSKQCRAVAKTEHRQEECQQLQQERASRQEKRSKKVQCDTCQKHFPYTKMKKCSRCRKATYCSVDCQRLDWQRHRDVCC